MTLLVEREMAFCRCDVCGAESEEIKDPVAAQRVAVTFFGWRVFKLNDKWQHACKGCRDKWREKQ